MVFKNLLYKQWRNSAYSWNMIDSGVQESLPLKFIPS